MEAGQFVALVGPSGSGKTTLLKSINRLVEPDAGTVAHRGPRRPRPRHSHALRHGIGYVIQGDRPVPAHDRRREYRHRRRADRRGRAEDRVAELLELVALPAECRAALSARNLSGGQAQRVGVARALAARPKLMLMDEPFGALDPVTRDALGRAYRELHDRLGLTTLMVTHDIAEALLLADRIVVLIDGRIRADARARRAARQRPTRRCARWSTVPRRQAERLAAL